MVFEGTKNNSCSHFRKGTIHNKGKIDWHSDRESHQPASCLSSEKNVLVWKCRAALTQLALQTAAGWGFQTCPQQKNLQTNTLRFSCAHSQQRQAAHPQTRTLQQCDVEPVGLTSTATTAQGDTGQPGASKSHSEILHMSTSDRQH